MESLTRKLYHAPGGGVHPGAISRDARRSSPTGFDLKMEVDCAVAAHPACVR
jgi:hypothetical protein